MVDFKELLKKPANQIERPKPLPAGIYYGIIKGFELGESREKKTPFVRFQLVPQEGGPEIDKSMLVGIDLSKKQLRRDFYLTEDALYRLNEFLDKIGVDNAGGTRSIGERLPDTKGKPVQFTVTQQLNKDDPSEVFNNVDDVQPRG